MPTRSRTRHHRSSSEFEHAAEALSRNVRALRRGRHWTFAEAAERFGVEPAYARSLEAGRPNPSLAVIVSIATAFEIAAPALLSSEPTRERAARK